MENIFDGEVVLIYLDNPSETFAGGIPIQNPVVEEKAGAKFITGRMPADPRDWSSDMPVGVALKNVAHFLVFATLEEFMQKSDFLLPGDIPVQ